jgi:hypothetical protein
MNEHQKVLVNFNCPLDLKQQFDQLLHHKNQSKTSVILSLIENYIDKELAKRKRHQEVVQDSDDDLMPAMFTSDDGWLEQHNDF